MMGWWADKGKPSQTDIARVHQIVLPNSVHFVWREIARLWSTRPAETQAYLAALAPVIDLEHRDGRASVARRVVPWRQAPLFVEQLESIAVDRRSASAFSWSIGRLSARRPKRWRCMRGTLGQKHRL